MHADSATSEVPQLILPPELVTELTRRGSAKNNLHVEGWKSPSLFGRLFEKLAGGSSSGKSAR